ncbi:MAG TPA: alpha/beta hydrolase [Pirellulales bacterium]|nr:alpha/beta hydrolase [Pirellulales bacterium]
MALAVSAGCANTHYVKVRSIPSSPLVERLKTTSRGGPQPSARTMQLLRQYNLAGELHGDMQPLLDKVQAIADQEPTPQKVYAFAELSYIAGKKAELTSPAAALDHYGASVTYAYKYLFDERYSPLRNPYDPEFRGACDLYNGSLESGLRIVKQQGALLPGRSHSIESASQAWDVKIVIRSERWQPADFAELKFVSDYEVQGLKNQYHSYGLGVPLIAIRSRQDSTDPAEKFMPPLMSFPVTAFLRVLPDEQMHATSSRRRHVALLELYDPLSSGDIEIGSRRVPLETDLSTPLAYFLNDPQLDLSDPKINLDAIATEGLLRPDKTQAETGLYMLQPYEPGKIPVLMVHGLWSSPMTWMEMFNDLRGDPAVRSRYQFWFYLYPTGQPFWQSATKLREDLAHARAVLDPQHREPAFDQMVLVGHSMGGLVSKMQVVASRNDFWNMVSDKPFTAVKASPEGRQHLEHMFFFRPDPAVRRLITIATPHRGSRFANGATRWLARELIRLPQMGREEIVEENPGLFREHTLLEVRTAVDSLAPDSPILPVLLEAPQPPWLKCHNIVGVLPDKGIIGSVAGGSDGVVSYASAHLDDAVSELKVDSDHLSVHRHPLSILEVRRILLEHLADLESFPHAPRGLESTVMRGDLQPPPALRPTLATDAPAAP